MSLDDFRSRDGRPSEEDLKAQPPGDFNTWSEAEPNDPSGNELSTHKKELDNEKFNGSGQVIVFKDPSDNTNYLICDKFYEAKDLK